MRRRGFALIAVLWLLVALSALTGGSLGRARTGSMAAANRMSLERTAWSAEACVSAMLAALDSASRSGGEQTVPEPILRRFANGTECSVHGIDPSSRILPDSATDEMLQRLGSIALSLGIPVESLVSVDGDGRVNLNSASAGVMAALPGLDLEAAEDLVSRRRQRGRFANLNDVVNALPGLKRDSVNARLTELGRIVSFAPARLLVVSSGRDARAPPVSTLELLLVPAGNRMATIRRRLL